MAGGSVLGETGASNLVVLLIPWRTPGRRSTFIQRLAEPVDEGGTIEDGVGGDAVMYWVVMLSALIFVSVGIMLFLIALIIQVLDAR